MTNRSSSGCKLFVANVSQQASPQEVKEMMEQYGRLVNFYMPRGAGTMHKGYGFVTYASPKDASKAIDDVNLRHFWGRLLTCSLARENNTPNRYGDTEVVRLRSSLRRSADWVNQEEEDEQARDIRQSDEAKG